MTGGTPGSPGVRSLPEMTGALRSDVRCAALGRDVVILDLATDAYLCAADALEAPGPFDPHHLTREARGLFSDAGLLVDSPIPGPSAAQIILPPPVRDLRDIAAGRLRPSDLPAVAAALIDVRRLGADPTVADLVARFAAHEPASGRDARQIGARAAAFAELLPWLPFEGACLRRSALLLAFLRRLGLAAHWVFGVRVRPFRAHCWIQIDDLCLNDDRERLVAYTPILIA